MPISSAAYLGAQAGGTALDLLGSLFGMGAKKKAQKQFDLSLEDLQKVTGTSVFDIGGIQSANRAAMFPQINKMTRDVSAQHNLDQPRVKQYLTDSLFSMEAQQLPGLMEREQTARSNRDVDIKRLVAQMRAMQLG